MAGLRSSFDARVWGLLLALALVVRVFVPQGMMVQQDEAGFVEIAICNSDATWKLPVSPERAPPDPAKADSGHCLFAGHAAGDAPPETPALALPQLASAAYDATRAQALASTFRRPAPPARAPPPTV